MNTDKLARATFVLHRETADELGYVARRMGVSRSALARDVLTEPVAMMARWMREVPANMTAEDARHLHDRMQGDIATLTRRAGG